MNFIFLCVFSGIQSLAATQKQCDYQTLHARVKEFLVKQRAAIQSVPPKTAITVDSTKTPDIQSKKSQEPRFIPQDDLELKMRLAQLLADTQLSDRFKMALITNAENLPASLGENQKDKRYPPWPWPPDQADSPFVRVMPSDFQAKMMDLVGAKTFEEIKAYFPKGHEFTTFEDFEPEHLSYQSEARVFEFVQSQLIELVRKKRLDTELSQADKRLIQKIKSVKLISFTDKERYRKLCQNNGGGYESSGHYAVICGEISEAEAIRGLSKQMASLIEPCSSQFPVYEIDTSKYKQLMDESEGAENASKFPSGFFHIASYIHKHAEMTGMIDGEVFDIESADGDLIRKFLIDKGVLKEKVLGSSFEEYGFIKEIKCYSTEKYGFRSESPNEIRNLINEIVQMRRNRAGDLYNAQQDRKNLIEAFAAKPHCNKQGPTSQMNDVVSSWASANIVSQYFESHSKVNAIPMFSDLSGLLTYKKGLDKRTHIEVIADAIRYLSSSDDKLSDRQKLEKFYLQIPQVRKSLDCSPVELDECLLVNENASDQQFKPTKVSK